MASNIYRFTIIGETLHQTLDEFSLNFNVSEEICERIKLIFDDIANKNIKKESESRENNSIVCYSSINAIEHEFKIHDGVCKFLLKNAQIKYDYYEFLRPHPIVKNLKVIACSLDNYSKIRKKIVKRK